MQSEYQFRKRVPSSIDRHIRSECNKVNYNGRRTLPCFSSLGHTHTHTNEEHLKTHNRFSFSLAYQCHSVIHLVIYMIPARSFQLSSRNPIHWIPSYVISLTTHNKMYLLIAIIIWLFLFSKGILYMWAIRFHSNGILTQMATGRQVDFETLPCRVSSLVRDSDEGPVSRSLFLSAQRS